MKSLVVAVTLLVAAVCQAAERQWQTGTWVSAGAKQDTWVGAPSRGGSVLGGSSTPIHPQVGIYVIDTDSSRITLQDIVPIETSCVEKQFAVGQSVRLALEKNTAFVRCEGEGEHRLRVTKKAGKPANRPKSPLILYK